MEIICPQCETVLNVPDDQINKKGRCLSCDSKFLIEESLIKKTAASKTIRKDQKKELPTDSVGLNDGFNDKINKSIFALLFASLGVLLSAWRVPSRQNIADIPTRPNMKSKELSDLQNEGFVKVPWQWPKQWL